jgi:hypothetical protein
LSQEREQENQNFKNKIAAGFNLYSTQDGKEIPVWAVRRFVSEAGGYEGFIGFDFGDGESYYIIGAKLFGVIQSYGRLNVLWCTALNLGFPEMGFTAGVGVEWFVTDNLSLAAETGLKVSLKYSEMLMLNIRTYADFVPQLSIKFYF